MFRLAAVVLVLTGCGRVGFDETTTACAALAPPIEDPGALPQGGVTYYVSPTGDDSVACDVATNPATPRRSLGAAFDCMAGGDTLLLRGGTYDEEVSTDFGSIRGGTSWETATHVAAVPGEVAILRPTSGVGRVLTLANPVASWMIFENLIFDAALIDPADDAAIKITYSGADQTNVSTHIRFIGGEIRNSPGRGISSGIGQQLIGVDIHDNGAPGIAAINGTTDLLLERCRIHDNRERSVEIYTSGPDIYTGITIRYNEFYDNAGDVLVGSSVGTQVYRNVLWDNGDGGIQVSYNDPTDIKIWNNTVFGDPSSSGFCMYIDTDAVRTDIRNNICTETAVGFTDSSTTTILRANLLGDPGYAAVATRDFELVPNSPAIDAGELVPEVAFTGTAPDLGAFEAPTATGAAQCDPQTVVVTLQTPFPPLVVENCGGFVVRTATGDIPVTNCQIGATAVRLTLAAPITGSATVVHDGTAIRDSARIGGTANAHMHPFELPIDP